MRCHSIAARFGQGSDLIAPESLAEDLVIARIEWAEATDSDRQRRDVFGVVTVAEALDREYIDRWAAALELQDAWRAIRDEASAGL